MLLLNCFNLLIFFRFLYLNLALFGFLWGWLSFGFLDWGVLESLRCRIINWDVFFKAFAREFG
jgi:hypothetical protein